MVTKINPTLTNIGRSFVGKTVQAYTIDLAVNATDFSDTELGPLDSIQEVFSVLAKFATITMYSALRADAEANDGQLFDVYFEGEFPVDSYDSVNAETLAAFLQTEVRALTAAGENNINLQNATVVAMVGSPFYADFVPAV
jgi:hypothetical protein